MKERPILFNGPMVRAIIEGRKNQTRRVVKPQPIGFTGRRFIVPDDAPKAWQDHPGPITDLCPSGVPGDRLWVRETWGCQDADHPQCSGGRKPQQGDKIVYRADDFAQYQWEGILPWRPSIHMPRWASRITLEIKRVWVERVQEISEADAIAEGYKSRDDLIDRSEWFKKHWDTNLWVWCIEFERVES